MASVPQASAHRRQLRMLHNGDHMKRRDFHRAYSQMPDNYRAELIGGIVFEPSPLGWPHGKNHARLIYLLETYCKHTPGTEIGDGASVFLSDEDEVQPDVAMRIVQECGGRSKLTRKRYVTGAPELVAEVAHSSRAIDLHLKKERYAATGVLEYVVLCLEPSRVYWFELHKGKQLLAGADGVFRSNVFPGLWIHEEGLLELDHELTDEALNRGLQTAEHAEFVARLKKSNRPSST
ncbi:MAG TPA: Uma2 family endonuclease [Candidatus Obscuribacterales bacterium]